MYMRAHVIFLMSKTKHKELKWYRDRGLAVRNLELMTLISIKYWRFCLASLTTGNTSMHINI